jgi:hypothetical protein
MSSNENPSQPVSSEQVPWNPWFGVFFVLVTFYVSQVVAALLLSIYPLLKHWTGQQAADWANSTVLAQFIFVVLAEGLVLLMLYGFLRGYRRTFRDIGLKPFRVTDLGYGIIGVPIYYVLYGLAVALAAHYVHGLDVNQHQEIGFESVTGIGPLLLTFISLVVLPPLAEEIMVRGFLYSSLKKALPLIWAALVTSALFAAAHLPEGSGGPLYIAALDTFILSLVLIYLREKTGSLWPCITLHAIKNGVAFVALFVLHVG